MDWARKCVVVIPCMNEAGMIGSVVTQAREWLPEVIVVDDGSTDDTAVRAAQAGATVIALPRTQGKGAAMGAGLRQAHARGFEWAALMDGDGQHAPGDLPALLHLAETEQVALVIGNRMAAPTGMPVSRLLANRFMSATLSMLSRQPLPDTQCGFRLLRLAAWAGLSLHSTHFEVESEMLIAFLAAGHPVAFMPIRSIYRASRSKIRPARDAVRWLRWLWGARQDFLRIRRQSGGVLRASSTMRVPK